MVNINFYAYLGAEFFHTLLFLVNNFLPKYAENAANVSNIRAIFHGIFSLSMISRVLDLKNYYVGKFLFEFLSLTYVYLLELIIVFENIILIYKLSQIRKNSITANDNFYYALYFNALLGFALVKKYELFAPIYLALYCLVTEVYIFTKFRYYCIPYPLIAFCLHLITHDFFILDIGYEKLLTFVIELMSIGFFFYFFQKIYLFLYKYLIENANTPRNVRICYKKKLCCDAFYFSLVVIELIITFLFKYLLEKWLKIDTAITKFITEISLSCLCTIMIYKHRSFEFKFLSFQTCLNFFSIWMYQKLFFFFFELTGIDIINTCIRVFIKN